MRWHMNLEISILSQTLLEPGDSVATDRYGDHKLEHTTCHVCEFAETEQSVQSSCHAGFVKPIVVRASIQTKWGIGFSTGYFCLLLQCRVLHRPELRNYNDAWRRGNDIRYSVEQTSCCGMSRVLPFNPYPRSGFAID